jgi:ferritin-like metal-binding protein YciE
MQQLNSLAEVFVDQLADLRSAEQQLVTALPKVSAAATSEDLREAFEEHLAETRGHVARLDQIFHQLELVPPVKHCKGMEGLIKEGDETVALSGDPFAKDAALIAAAQRIEHYEIAAYGTASTLAGELGYDDSQGLLDETLKEEGNADKRLTNIATGGLFTSGVNRAAL